MGEGPCPAEQPELPLAWLQLQGVCRLHGAVSRLPVRKHPKHNSTRAFFSCCFSLLAVPGSRAELSARVFHRGARRAERESGAAGAPPAPPCRSDTSTRLLRPAGARPAERAAVPGGSARPRRAAFVCGRGAPRRQPPPATAPHGTLSTRSAAARGSWWQIPRHVAASRSRPVAPPHPTPPPPLSAWQRPRPARGSGCSDPLPRGTKRGRRPRGSAVPVSSAASAFDSTFCLVWFLNSFFFFFF